jgi:hypothetical protein
MPYPRNIRLDDYTLTRLRSYLQEELFNHYAERGEWIEELKNWQKDYWAKSKTERATFPFTGASRLIIPLTAISVEAIHSRTMTTLFGLTQFATAKSRNAELADAATQVERLLDHEILGNNRNYDQIDYGLLELEKYGTGIIKSSYDYKIKTAVKDIIDPSTGEVIDSREFDVVVRQGATIDAVQNGRFLMPFAHNDAQTAPWCGEEHEESPYTIKQLVNSGFFYPEVMDEIEKWVNISAVGGSSPLPMGVNQAQQAALEKRNPVWPKTITWVGLQLEFDVDQSGRDKEIVVHFHVPSGMFMSIRYNWHTDLHRDYRKGVYFPVEFRWPGIGICKQAEQFQKEITTMHRQRLDAGTIANMPMLKVHKLSGYGPKEPLFPGKMWFLDDMTYIEPFKMSEVNASAFSNEQSSVIYAQQRTGVNEVVLGMPQVGTPGTATSDLARIQEGNKKFDYAFKNEKRLITEVTLDVAVNIAQFGARNVEYFELVENAELAKQFFSIKPELIRANFVIQIGVAGQQQNKILDRQNWTQVAAILQQYYDGMLQLATYTGNKDLVFSISQKGIIAGTEAMTQILESFDIRNIDRIVLSELLNQQQKIANSKQLSQGAAYGGGPATVGTLDGGSGQSQDSGSSTGMDFISQIAQTIGAGS